MARRKCLGALYVMLSSARRSKDIRITHVQRQIAAWKHISRKYCPFIHLSTQNWRQAFRDLGLELKNSTRMEYGLCSRKRGVAQFRRFTSAYNAAGAGEGKKTTKSEVQTNFTKQIASLFSNPVWRVSKLIRRPELKASLEKLKYSLLLRTANKRWR